MHYMMVVKNCYEKDLSNRFYVYSLHAINISLQYYVIISLLKSKSNTATVWPKWSLDLHVSTQHNVTRILKPSQTYQKKQYNIKDFYKQKRFMIQYTYEEWVAL